MKRSAGSGIVALLLLSGCGGSGGGVALPEPTPVDAGRFETYRTNHNGFSRVRMDHSTAADAPILAGFEDADPSDPAGYRDLIALIARNEALHDGTMVVEVIAQIDAGNGDKATRLLRLTADQAPFENVRNGRLVEASGTYHFRGQSFAWVTIDDGPLLSGRHDQGLENLVLDFDNRTASINIRTEVAANSEVEIGLTAAQLPFDIVSGAYGGAVTINVRNPEVTESYAVDGHLRGNVGGRPGYSDHVHGLTTSGLYTASGSDNGTAVTVEGVYMGADPNVAR